MAVAYVNISQLLKVTQAYLMGSLGLPKERVRIVADFVPGKYPVQGDQVLEIRPGKATRPVWWSDGHSRISSWRETQVEIRVWTRLALDSAAEDELFLTHGAYGHEVLVEKIEDLLDDWVPLVGGAAMTIQPVKHIQTSEPSRKERSPGWGESFIMVQMGYQAQRSGQIRAGQ